MLNRLKTACTTLLRRRTIQAYLALLLASHLVIAVFNPRWFGGPEDGAPAEAERISATVRVQHDSGAGSRDVRLSALRWPAHGTPGQNTASATTPPSPIILLHGSPSSGGRDFDAFAPLLSREGRTVYALDRPGFGASSKYVPSYSILANARYVLAFMDAMNIPRAHIVGWSQGGGAALHMADLAPDRIASITLMCSIGIQEGEGSGDYYFEHVKYAIGYAGLVVLPELLPHFNLLGQRSLRHAFIRDFLDTDQRPLRGIMERLDTPTLILHGRRDWLVASWVAEEHHKLIAPSRLVMLDTGHFFPLGPPMSPRSDTELAARILAGFCAEHEAPGSIVNRGVADMSPRPRGQPETGADLGKFHLSRSTPWIVTILVIIAATLISEDFTVIAVGLLIASQKLDAGVGLMGCFLGIVIGDYGLWALGRFLGRRILRIGFFRKRVSEEALAGWGRALDKHTAKTVFLSRCIPGTRLPMYVAAGILGRQAHHFLLWVTIAVAVWTPLLLLLTLLIGPRLLEVFKGVFHGPWAILAAFLVLYLFVRFLTYEVTWQGRHRLKADLKRLVSPEFWPAWLFYLPLVPWFAWLALRYRGPMTFTCANPGIPYGGGIVGESKSQILAALEHAPAAKARIAPWRLAPAPDTGGLDAILSGPESEAAAAQRAERVIRAVREEPDLGGYPVILKPDVSQRGHALKLARCDDDVREYCREMTRDAMVQRYHEGPYEAGVLWARRIRDGVPTSACGGEIISVTRKVFPVLEGDGVRTLERLIWEHPRFRLQAKVFLARFENELQRVPDKGERVRLAIAGNHCQGTLFKDGSDLITPELTARLSEIADAFRDPRSGGGFDFGRFDLRYSSDEELRRGEGFMIVELNGTMSESTNMYDPDKPIWWTYKVLYRHWARLFAIGARRRREGVKPMTILGIRAAVKHHFKGRPGSAVSD